MDEIKNTIEIIVALATVFSLVVIWLTLREMKIQRHKSYEPYILPVNFEILFLCRYPQIIFPINTYSKIDNIKVDKKMDSPLIKLRNIGQGVAKDISANIDWNIKYHKYFETLKSEFDNLKIGIDLKVSKNNCWFDLNEDKKVLSGGNYPYQNDYYQDFDYLLPVRENDEEIRIEIPSSVNLLFELSILLMELLPDYDKEGAYKRLQKCFLPIVKIDYKDNLGKPFSSEYTLNIKTLKIQMQGDINGKIYTLGIERLK